MPAYLLIWKLLMCFCCGPRFTTGVEKYEPSAKEHLYPSLFPAHTYIHTKTFIHPKINDGLHYALATLIHQMCVWKSNNRLWENELDIYRQPKRLLTFFWSFILKVHCHLLSVRYLMYSILCNAFTTCYIQLIRTVHE